jgi:hypothetical protein
MESFGLTHVDDFFQVPICESGWDIHRTKLHVFNGCSSQSGAQGSSTECVGEGVVIVNARTLGTPFGNNSALVAFNITLRCPFGLENPTGWNSLLSRRQINKLPCPIGNEREDFVCGHCFPYAALEAKR